MFCTNCGNQIKEGSRFCGKCGAQVNADVVVETPVVENPVVEVPVKETPVAKEDVFKDIPDVVEPTKEDALFEDESNIPEETPVVFEAPQDPVVAVDETPVVENPVVVEDAPESITPEQPAEEQPITVVAEKPATEETDDAAPIETVVPPAETVPQSVLEEAPAPLSQYQSENAAVSSSLKKSLGSVVAIIAAVIYLITIGIKALGAVKLGQNLNVTDVAGAFSADMADYELWSNTGVYALLFIGLIPMLLIAFGLIFNVIQSYRKKSFCSAGFTTIRIAEIIKLVINSIVFAGAAFGVVFALVLFDGVIDDLAKQLNVANVTANFEPLKNTGKWVMLAACGFIALWKALEIAQNAVVLFGARKMKDALSSGCSKERRFAGLRIFNYILVFINGIILSIQIVCLIMSQKIIEIVGETVSDLGTFTSGDTGVFEELTEHLCKNSLWGLIATALLICVYLMYNANLSNFVQKDEQIEIQK